MSANRDEAVFDDPFAFDITRDPNLHTLHVAFGGGGPHFCLGANLARAEIKVMFAEIARRIPEMELNGPGAPPALELHQRHQGDAGGVPGGLIASTTRSVWACCS